jgi:hypothetical protein
MDQPLMVLVQGRETGAHPPELNQPPPVDDPPALFPFFFLGLAGRGPLAAVEAGLEVEPKHIVLARECCCKKDVWVLCCGDDGMAGVLNFLA